MSSYIFQKIFAYRCEMYFTHMLSNSVMINCCFSPCIIVFVSFHFLPCRFKIPYHKLPHVILLAATAMSHPLLTLFLFFMFHDAFAYMVCTYHLKKPYIWVWDFTNISRTLVQSDFFSFCQIWSCVECYCFFHLTCIQRWAKDSVAHQKQALEDQPPGSVVTSYKWAW